MRFRARARSSPVWLALLASLLLSAPAGAMTKAEETRLGRQVMQEVRPLGLTQEAPLNEIGARIAEVTQRRDVAWRFWVVEGMEEFNAFAAPGGLVFISRPYYAKLNDDETAFVIGHEMAHVDLNHIDREMKRYRNASIGGLLLKILANSTLIGTAIDIGSSAYVTHYSRALEREADLTGYRYAQAAGYDAQAAVTALSKLGKEPKLHPWIAQVYATHPMLESREDQLAALEGKEPDTADPPPPAPSHANALTGGLQPFDPKVPIAVRILGSDGKRWENPWRKSFTKLLHNRLTPLGFTIAGDDLMYKPNIGDPVVAARSRQARYLILVTVQQMSSASRAAPPPAEAEAAPAKADTALAGTPVEAEVAMTAKLVDVTSGTPVWSGEFHEQLSGTDILPGDPEVIYTDTTMGSTAWEAAGQFAIASAKAAGAVPAPPPTAESAKATAGSPQSH
jgi:Zn-dependent protease with chaperone function